MLSRAQAVLNFLKAPYFLINSKLQVFHKGNVMSLSGIYIYGVDKLITYRHKENQRLGTGKGPWMWGKDGL